MSVQNLAAVGEQLEDFELAAVGGHHDVAVVFAQELHVQHLIAVAHKLREERVDGVERERLILRGWEQ